MERKDNCIYSSLSIYFVDDFPAKKMYLLPVVLSLLKYTFIID